MITVLKYKQYLSSGWNMRGLWSLIFYHALLLLPNITYISRQYPCVFLFFVKQVSCINYRSHSPLEAWLILCNFRSIIPSGKCRDRTYLDLAAQETWNENNYTSGHSRLVYIIGEKHWIYVQYFGWWNNLSSIM